MRIETNITYDMIPYQVTRKASFCISSRCMRVSGILIHVLWADQEYQLRLVLVVKLVSAALGFEFRAPLIWSPESGLGYWIDSLYIHYKDEDPHPWARLRRPD